MQKVLKETKSYIKKFFFLYFSPDYFINDILDLEVDILKKEGITHLLLDADNTLILDGELSCSFIFQKKIENLQKEGLTLIIISNGKADRIAKLAKSLKVDFLAVAMKPKTKRVKQLISKLNLELNQLGLVGDQIFTDVLLAKRLGILSILVNPLSSKERFYIKIKRYLENLIKSFLKIS